MDTGNKTEIKPSTLFFDMLMISTFTFGGGFVIIGMMKKKFCEERHWVTEDEVLDMTAIAQSAPGALAVNSAIIFGYRIAGIKGALISVLATIIPPLVIISIITMIYDAFSTNVIVQTALRVMRAGVAAIIADVTIGLAGKVIKTGNILNIILMAAAFIASWYFSVSSITIILLFIALGIAMNFFQTKGRVDL
ncbi:MAG: chromate transporter [Erysipelotrichaceae bacterium]|nr:chromate transporter [Erysipelotrichaceae bacterium]